MDNNKLYEIDDGVYELKNNNISYILTKDSYSDNINQNKKIKFNNEIYRVWNYKKSKLGTLYKKKCKGIPSFKNKNILYLGASYGTTVSHISDILYNENGIIYAVEISEFSMKSLINISKIRKNILPIFSNAYYPETYNFIVNNIDIIYQDISQINQFEIAMRNVDYYLNINGFLILILKARSISSTLEIEKIYNEEIKKIRSNNKLKIINIINLKPYYNDHLCIIAKLLNK